MNWFTYRANIEFLDNHWDQADLLILTTWNTLSVSVPLMLFCAAVESFKHRNLFGVLWLVIAGATAMIANVRLRLAEGVNLRPVKSGDFYKRANIIARRNGIDLKNVYVVPFGKGRLTNAYGGYTGIALTDDYGHWLRGGELDFIIGHELAHVQKRHGIRKLLLTASLFLGTALLGTAVPSPSKVGVVIFDFGVLLFPLLIVYFVSQRFEFDADRLALEFTDVSKSLAVSALTNIYQRTETPPDCSHIEELFQTHPSLRRRVTAIDNFRRLHPD